MNDGDDETWVRMSRHKVVVEVSGKVVVGAIIVIILIIIIITIITIILTRVQMQLIHKVFAAACVVAVEKHMQRM